MDFLKDLSLDKVRNLAEDAFNQAKPKTDLEAKVYEVLSHKNWGSSSTLMNEIARDTFDYEKFAVVSQILWESMENQRPAAWRVVFKGLTLLEHLIKNGSERCVDDARNHGHSLRALHQFNYYEGTIDRGLGVREKSKQLVEILADDERIRDERQRAKKLRDKFGGSLGGTGSSGGGGGGGQYAGYGNDNWNSTGGSSAGGYGDGGIGSSRNGGGGGGRYDDDNGSSGAVGYSGRYDNDSSTVVAAAPTPTFAAIPEETPKKAKSKKKKNLAHAAEPVVDLFSFDDPTPTPAAGADDDEFDNFQSADGAPATPAFAVSDPFAAPMQQTNTHFDAFGDGSNQSHQSQFGAFTDAPAQPATSSKPDMFSSGNIMSGGVMMHQPMGGSVMGAGMRQQPMGGLNVTGGASSAGFSAGGGMNGSQAKRQQFQNDDDDFGDFADAGSSKTMSSGGPASSKPLTKLISLDGLCKNSNKVEDKLNQPIIANAAAATFVQEKEQIQATVQKSTKGSSMSFAGIDGLHHNSSMMSGMQMGGHMNTMMPPAMSMGVNPSVMGSSSASASLIGMLDPSAMVQNKNQSQMAQQPQPGMVNPQMQGIMNPQMQGIMNPQMQGMMNPQMQGMMNPQMQGMMNPQMQGMMNPQMMGGNVGGMGMMNPNMPQQGFGGMHGGMMMNNPGMGINGMQGTPGMGMQGTPGMGTPGAGMNGIQGNHGIGMNSMQGQSMSGFNMQTGTGQHGESSMGGGPLAGFR